MFNKTILKQTIKANLKIWLIITVVLSVFNTVLIGVFDPKTMSNMSEMVKGTPLANILGNTTFLGMLSQTFYSIQGVILPLIFIIITASSLIVSQVDRGSMAYLLSTPTKRSVVVKTQALYFVTSLFIMFVIVTITGLISIQAFHGGVWGAASADKGIAFSIHDYLMLNLGLFLLMFATSSISFMFSCIFNLSKNYMALGAGIPLAFFLFQMMGQVGDNLKGIKYLTLNSLFDTHAILNGGDYLLQFIALSVVGIVLYIIGMCVFEKKDLPL